MKKLLLIEAIILVVSYVLHSLAVNSFNVFNWPYLEIWSAKVLFILASLINLTIYFAKKLNR